MSGALFSPPDPSLAPGTAASGKKRLRKRGINFKGPSRIFSIFHRLILRCSLCSETSGQASALLRDRVSRRRSSVEGLGSSRSFFAMQNDPPLVRDQETVWSSAICRESREAKLDWILRRNGDFANQPFRAPVKEHLAAKWADGSFDEATTEALAFRRIYFRTAQFGPAEY